MYREWLNEAMRQAGISQSELARVTGINVSVINRMVLGRRAIRDHEIVALGRALGSLPPTSPMQKTDDRSVEPLVELVRVVDVVQDGFWREKKSPGQTPPFGVIPVLAHSIHAHIRRAVYIRYPVEEASISIHHMIFAPIGAVQRKFKQGDLVYGTISRDEFELRTILRYTENVGREVSYRSFFDAEKEFAVSVPEVLGLVVEHHIRYRE